MASLGVRQYAAADARPRPGRRAQAGGVRGRRGRGGSDRGRPPPGRRRHRARGSDSLELPPRRGACALRPPRPRRPARSAMSEGAPGGLASTRLRAAAGQAAAGRARRRPGRPSPRLSRSGRRRGRRPADARRVVLRHKLAVLRSTFPRMQAGAVTPTSAARARPCRRASTAAGPSRPARRTHPTLALDPPILLDVDVRVEMDGRFRFVRAPHGVTAGQVARRFCAHFPLPGGRICQANVALHVERTRRAWRAARVLTVEDTAAARRRARLVDQLQQAHGVSRRCRARATGAWRPRRRRAFSGDAGSAGRRAGSCAPRRREPRGLLRADAADSVGAGDARTSPSTSPRRRRPPASCRRCTSA